MNAQQLKNSILQMAVQGKLVPQDPTDEPASVLLERIREEKEKLIKAGKIKREKNPSVIFRGSDNLPYEKTGKETRCIAEEVPFEIPDTWEWVRFVNLVKYAMGKTPPRKDSDYWDDPVFYWISIADMIPNGHIESTKEKVSAIASKQIFKERITPAGTLLMSFKLTVGRVSITDIASYHNEAIISIYPFVDDEKLITEFLFHTLPFLSTMGETKTAIKGNTLNSDSLDALLIPLPPLAEQKRIVAKIEELLPHLEDYDRAETRVSKLNAEFPEQLKKSILQWAIQGKLVPQDSNDEPASVLLERIRAEKAKLVKAGKIKKDKNESVIFRRDNSHYEKLNGNERCIDDEIPFEIPGSWIWVRLNSIYNFIDYRGKTPTKISTGIPLITAKNIKIGYISHTPAEFISEAEFSERKSRGISQKGDILFTTEAPLGNAALADIDNFSTGQRIITLQQYGNSNHLDNKLILSFILSPYFQVELKNNNTGTTVAGIKAARLKQLLLPIPPLAEQKRIVAEIERIFSLQQTMRVRDFTR